MSDIVRRLRALQHFDVCYPVPHPTCEEAAARIAQLEAALRAIDEQFAEAAQDDCENGVRWLNKRAAETYLYEYPHTSAAISFAHKVARAALAQERQWCGCAPGDCAAEETGGPCGRNP